MLWTASFVLANHHLFPHPGTATAMDGNEIWSYDVTICARKNYLGMYKPEMRWL